MINRPLFTEYDNVREGRFDWEKFTRYILGNQIINRINLSNKIITFLAPVQGKLMRPPPINF